MSQKIGTVYVDEVYSAMFIENLRPESFLIDGITFTSKYAQGDPKAGVVWFHKLSTTSKGSQAVGGDYEHEEASDSLVPIYVTNAFRRSKKLRGVVAAQITAPFMDGVATEQAKDVRVDKDACAIAGLVHGGTESEDTTAITTENVVSEIIAGKKELRKKKVTPNVLLVSPDVEAALMEAHLTKAIFTPVTNDELVRAGVIGRYLGMYIFPRVELSDEANTAVKYRNNAEQSVDLSKVDYVMYNSDFFGKIDSFEEARIAPSNEFAGMYANIEQNAGFGVVNADAVLVKKHV